MYNTNKEETESGCLGSLCLLFYRLFQSTNRIQSQRFSYTKIPKALYFNYSESSDYGSDDSSTSSNTSGQQYTAGAQSLNTNLPHSKLKIF